MRCPNVSPGGGGSLVAAAAALSVVIAQGRTADELELLAALFEIIGDNLGLLALQPSNCECPSQSKAEQNRGRCP